MSFQHTDFDLLGYLALALIAAGLHRNNAALRKRKRTQFGTAL